MTDAAKKVKRMFSRLGPAPSAEDVLGNLSVSPAGVRDPVEPMVQVNVRVPVSTKKKLRLMAARDSKGISEVILDAIALYEERHGAAPDL